MRRKKIIITGSLALIGLTALDTFSLPIPFFNSSIKIISFLVTVLLFLSSSLALSPHRTKNRFSNLRRSGFNYLLLFVAYVIWREVSLSPTPDHNTYLSIRNLLLAMGIFLSLSLTTPSLRGRSILLVFRIITLVSLLVALANIFFHSQMVAISSHFYFPGNIRQYLDYEYQRGRIYSQTSVPVVAGIMLNFFLLQPSVISLFFAAVSASLVLLWNYRTYFAAYVVLSTIYALMLQKFRSGSRNFLALSTGFLLIVILASFFSRGGLVSRFTLSNEYDRKTIISRFQYFAEAIRVARDSPIFGVGLGSYHLFADPIYLEPTNEEVRQGEIRGMALQADPHNFFLTILAETGIIGLLLFVLLLAQIFRFDLRGRYLKGQSFSGVFRFASWIFLLSFTFDTVTEANWFLFWGLRGIIVSLEDGQ